MTRTACGWNQDDSDAFQSARSAIENNWNQLDSFAGTCTIEDRETRESGGVVSFKYTIEFAINRHTRQFRWRIFQKNDSEGLSLQSTVTFAPLSKLVKHSSLYQFDDQNISQQNSRQFSRRTLLIGDLHAAVNPMAIQEFDLMYFLTGGIDTLDQVFRRIGGKSRFSIPGLFEVLPEKSHDCETIQFVSGTLRTIVRIGNLQNGAISGVERQTKDKTEYWEFTYSGDGSAGPPQEIAVRIDDRENKTIFNRTIRFNDATVNGEVDPLEFSLARLGAKHGDIIRDVRTKGQYVYSESYSDRETRRDSQDNDQMFPLLILNSAVWLCLFGFYAAWHRRKASNKAKG